MQEMKRQRVLIGARLQQARLRSGFTIEEAAAAADVEPLAVEAWERGRAMPCLVQLRELLQLYCVMACEILYETNPFAISREEAAELTRVSRSCSPAVQSKVDLLLTVMASPQDCAETRY
jgi:transcriptional regulator with XRE-family HTH domain